MMISIILISLASSSYIFIEGLKKDDLQMIIFGIVCSLSGILLLAIELAKLL